MKIIIETFDLDKLKQSVKSRINDYGKSTICNIISKLVEDETNKELKDITDFIHIFDNNDQGIKSGGHHVNISNDKSTIYDFTGDQYSGDYKSSELWIYKKVDDGIYCTHNREPSDLPSGIDFNDDYLNSLSKFLELNDGYRIIII